MTAAQVRAALWARLRVAGPDIWALAIAATTITNLADFAALPAPGERPGAGFALAAALRVALVLFATYAIQRRMAGAARAMTPDASLGRFAAFGLATLVAFGLASVAASGALGLAQQPLATQWLGMLLIAAVWGVAVIRLIGIGAGLSVGAPFKDVPALVRATRGAGIGLAVAFLQVVLPFAAGHLALTLIAVRVPLASEPTAALALIDGIVSAVQLMLSSGLAVVAWSLASPSLRGPAPRR